MFTKSVKKVSERMKKGISFAPIEEIDSLFINPGTKGKVIQVSIEEISHLEALDHSVIIYTLNEKHITKIRLKELDEKLPATKFIKVHRSFVVNIKLIKSIAGSQITLANGKIVPLGDSFRNLLLAKIQHRTV